MKPALVFDKIFKIPLLIFVGFSVLAVSAHFIPYFSFDIQITQWLQSYKPHWFLELMQFISLPGNLPYLPLFIASGFTVLYLLKLKNAALVNLTSLLSALFFSSFLKTIINRPRPIADLVDVYTVLHDKSFPSGHTLTYTLVFGFFIYLVFKGTLSKNIKHILYLLFLLPIITIGISRIYLGVHWTSDVVGGYLLGLFWLLYAIRYYRNLQFS